MEVNATHDAGHEQSLTQLAANNRPTWRLSRPIPVIIVHECFERVALMDALHQITNSDLNNEAVSPHNPDLISPSDWLYSQGNF